MNDLLLIDGCEDLCPECDDQKDGVRFQVQVLHSWSKPSFLCKEHFLRLANGLNKPGSWMVCACATQEQHCDNCHCDKCCDHCRSHRAVEGSWGCGCRCCGRYSGPLVTPEAAREERGY